MKKLLLVTTLMALPLAANATPTITSPPCSDSDINLTIGTKTYSPAACATNALSPGNPTTQTGQMNAALGTNFSLAADTGTPPDSLTLQGIKFTLSAVTTNPANTTGTWTVTWQDVNGTAAPLNLPITTDFDVGIFGGSTGDAYDFENVLLPASPTSGTGNFTITFTNNGGQNPALSHMVLAAGDMADAPPTDAPEPASLTLFGVGLAALGFVTRRRVKG